MVENDAAIARAEEDCFRLHCSGGIGRLPGGSTDIQHTGRACPGSDEYGRCGQRGATRHINDTAAAIADRESIADLNARPRAGHVQCAV